MTNLQDPSVPAPVAAIEIDEAIYNLHLKLETSLDWLTHGYGRAYRFQEKKNKRLYIPEIYIGGDRKSYHAVTPDNDKKGLCFFVVGKEENKDFDQFHHNFLQWNVGIVFSVNLKAINEALLGTEIFTQNLIRDVRHLLTRELGGMGFQLQIREVVQELREIYQEFTIDESKDYTRAPSAGFRFNCRITLQEKCGDYMFDPEKALLQNISPAERVTVLLPTIDFSIQNNFNNLTAQQKVDLLNKLQP